MQNLYNNIKNKLGKFENNRIMFTLSKLEIKNAEFTWYTLYLTNRSLKILKLGAQVTSVAKFFF